LTHGWIHSHSPCFAADTRCIPVDGAARGSNDGDVANACIHASIRSRLIAGTVFGNDAGAILEAERAIALLQQGRISIYLMYSFTTLIALLLWVRR